MREKGGRHEIKHFISVYDLMKLRGRLPLVTKPDEHSRPGGGYLVRSLYFDNPYDKALREKLDGVDDREKFRLRFYNGDTSFIRLEKKRKKSGLCYKDSAVITREECEELLGGRYDALKARGDPLLLEFYAKLSFQQLHPKNIVEYKREAYVFPAGNVRITLDHEIRTTTDVKQFLNEQLISVPIPETIILEVKYDAFLPEIIRGLCSLSDRQSTAFSKYAAARMI